jgi:hydroxyacylglutathione hydrolase
MGNIKIEKMVLGMVQTNTWFVINEKTKELILIDPADDAGRIIRKIEADGLKLQGILLTHGHFDHIGAVDDLRAYFKDVQCYAGEKEEEVLENGSYNLSASWAAALSIRADRLLRDKETLTLAGFKIKVIETPGHTKGGVCYYLSEEGVLFSGDTLFRTSVGRTDFPTGSMSQIVRSVQYLTENLPGDTVVYPGHQEITTIAYEQRFNPYLS